MLADNVVSVFNIGEICDVIITSIIDLIVFSRVLCVFEITIRVLTYLFDEFTIFAVSNDIGLYNRLFFKALCKT